MRRAKDPRMASPGPQRGFSLIELAFVIFSVGFVLLVVANLVSSVNQSASNAGAAATDPVEEVRLALLGMVKREDRLPCPDTDGDGFENCGAARVGAVPFRTLGLSKPPRNVHGHELHYGVHRAQDASPLADADLTRTLDRFQPLLPPTNSSAVTNGLDFCQALANGATAGALVGTEPASGGVNPAFLLVDPGQIDADGDGRLFDGGNATGLAFQSPGVAATNTYDDRVVTVGFNEFATSLGCPPLVAAVNAAARNAYASYDIHRAEDFYLDFREFVVRLSEDNLEIAELKRLFAILNIALAAATAATDIALAITSASGAAGVAISAVNAAIAIGLAAESLISAEADVAAKTQELAEARARRDATILRVARALADRDARIAEARALDARGWFQ